MARSDEALIQGYLASPELLLDSIDQALEHVPVEQLPLSGMSGEEGKEASYREIEDGRPKHTILEAMLRNVNAELEHTCCVKVGYCKLIKSKAPTIDVAKAVLDGLISGAFTFPIPVATVTVYCIQSLYLDRLCKCNGSES
jgi:hypothetical protein